MIIDSTRVVRITESEYIFFIRRNLADSVQLMLYICTISSEQYMSISVGYVLFGAT